MKFLRTTLTTIALALGSCAQQQGRDLQQQVQHYADRNHDNIIDLNEMGDVYTRAGYATWLEGKTMNIFFERGSERIFSTRPSEDPVLTERDLERVVKSYEAEQRK